MKACRDFQKNGAAYLSGELDMNTNERLSSHLQECPDCRDHLDRMKNVIDSARPLKNELDNVLRSVDWEALAQKVTRAAFDKGSRPVRAGGFGFLRGALVKPRMATAAAALAIGLVLGSAATYLLINRPRIFRARSDDFFASPDLLGRMELAMAKRETLDYLEQSRYLLLDFVRIDPSQSRAASKYPDSPRVRELLTKKKYLNAQLGHRRMIQAKAICDEIEMLFLELAQISDDLPAAELKRIQAMIEERQVLLMINLVKHELEREA